MKIKSYEQTIDESFFSRTRAFYHNLRKRLVFSWSQMFTEMAMEWVLILLPCICRYWGSMHASGRLSWTQLCDTECPLKMLSTLSGKLFSRSTLRWECYLPITLLLSYAGWCVIYEESLNETSRLMFHSLCAIFANPALITQKPMVCPEKVSTGSMFWHASVSCHCKKVNEFEHKTAFTVCINS